MDSTMWTVTSSQQIVFIMIVAQNSDETFIEQYKELLLNYAQDENPVDNIITCEAHQLYIWVTRRMPYK